MKDPTSPHGIDFGGVGDGVGVGVGVVNKPNPYNKGVMTRHIVST